jgi:hypothetical protein
MKTNYQDPQTSEMRSTQIAGMQESLGKIEDILDMQLQAEAGIALTEVYISAGDRYRIFQAPVGKRNWAASPAPVIYKNGIAITEGFTIDSAGGAIIVSPSAISTDVFTTDVSYTKVAGNKLDAHLADLVTDSDGAHGLKIESGTFTPTITGATAAGTHTYTVNVGIYKKMGKIVHFKITIALSAKDAAMAGDVGISGLPFPVENVVTGTESFVVGGAGNLLQPAGGITLLAYASVNTAKILLRWSKSNAAHQNVVPTDISNSTSLVISGTYFTTT